MPSRTRRPTRPLSPRPSSLIQQALEEVIEKKLSERERSGPLARDLRRIGQAVARLERRLERLAERSNGAQGRRHKGAPRRAGRPPTHTVCTLHGCRGAHYARGLCSKHYQQQRRARE